MRLFRTVTTAAAATALAGVGLTLALAGGPASAGGKPPTVTPTTMCPAPGGEDNGADDAAPAATPTVPGCCLDGDGDTDGDHLVTPTTMCPTPPTTTPTTTPPTATALLSLRAIVVNRFGGTATAADFDLFANGPESVSGVTGAPAVTLRSVLPGTYDLSDVADALAMDPYTASSWDCTGSAATTGSSVTLDAGEAAICVVAFTDNPAASSAPSGPGGATGATGATGASGQPGGTAGASTFSGGQVIPVTG